MYLRVDPIFHLYYSRHICSYIFCKTQKCKNTSKPRIIRLIMILHFANPFAIALQNGKKEVLLGTGMGFWPLAFGLSVLMQNSFQHLTASPD